MTVVRGPLDRTLIASAKRLRELAAEISSPYADQVFVAKDRTKADLARDIIDVAAHMELSQRLYPEFPD